MAKKKKKKKKKKKNESGVMGRSNPGQQRTAIGHNVVGDGILQPLQRQRRQRGANGAGGMWEGGRGEGRVSEPSAKSQTQHCDTSAYI